MNKAIIVADLAFGDSGKGSMVDYLARLYDAELVVRYGGGPQCAHHVVLKDGTWHAFSQFGSGTFSNARTFLSRHVLIEPLSLAKEAAVLEGKGVRNPLALMVIDPRCVIITAWHRLANRIREAARGSSRHGSVGLGVGETRQDQLNGHYMSAGGNSIRALDSIRDRKIEQMRPFKEAAPELFSAMETVTPEDQFELYRDIFKAVPMRAWSANETYHNNVVYEGHQGVLLDETVGFAPYNTWTDCTMSHATDLIDEAGGCNTLKVGILRTYFTRHGSGPFPTESDFLPMEVHNGIHPYMGPFRAGHFDAVLARYALKHCPVDCLAITHMDRVPSTLICESYRDGWEPTAKSLLAAVPLYTIADGSMSKSIGQALGVPVRFESRGATALDKLEHKV